MLTSLSASGKIKSKLKWFDEYKNEDKHLLITNNSREDLIHKEEDQV
jgi:hypothetical protein